MSDNKKYYYLKLKDNFFDSDELMVLESLPDGYMYSNILLKLYLRGLKNDGKLMVNERIPYNSTMLATVTRHPVAVVEKAIKIFIDLGLIEVMENGAIYLLDIQNYIGESSTEADRKRIYRNKIQEEKKLMLGQTVGQMSDKCPTNVQTNLHQSIEIEIEKEIDIDKDKDTARACEATLTDDQCKPVALNTVNPMTSKAKKQGAKKIQYAEFVAMTNDEYQSLIANERLGSENAVKRCIEILDNYKGSSGKKYASDYRAILNWVITRYEEECSKQVAKETKASGACSLVQMIKDGVVNGADKENAEKSGSAEGNIVGIMSQIPRV